MSVSSQNEPVVFSQMFEALVMHAMRGKLDPDTVRRIEAAGLDLSNPLLVAYPLTVWYDVVWTCAQLLFPALPRTEAMYATGRKVADGYSHTTMGKALFSGLRRLGWQRALGQMARSLRTGGNFLSSRPPSSPTAISRSPWRSSPSSSPPWARTRASTPASCAASWMPPRR
jgi:uncharacterized protein (TIGR02265 family)